MLSVTPRAEVRKHAVRSFLRWAGSKRRLGDELAAYWPASVSRYVEPFGGSACLFFHLEPARALISDLNAELIAMYQALQLDTELVLESFRRLRRGKKAYYAVRKCDPMSLCSVEAAARFLYLNRYCFNGLFRTNQRGTFNVPYGPPKKTLKAFEDRVRAAATLLRNAELRSCDFGDVLRDVRRGDFVYLDPPYAVSERRKIFSDYLPDSFSAKDIARLSDGLDHIDRSGASFLLSYSNSPEVSDFKQRWTVRTISSRRNIAGFVGARKITSEILITNMRRERK